METLRWEFALPDWTGPWVERYGRDLGSDREKMEFAIELSRQNVRQGTGGPFGAAVFEEGAKTPLAVGVNLVVPTNCSAAHAEVVALTLGEKRHGAFPFRAKGGRFDLFSSSQPCVMCYGALLWAGVNRLLFGALAEDVKGIVGFDEGPLTPRWREELETRGVEVVSGLCRPEAVGVLREYRDSGGVVYNGQPLVGKV